jgi:microcystin-dependent protein
MSRNIFAGGGVQTFQGSNNPLYVQNMNSLKAAFTDLQDSISIAAPIGAVLMWSGACTLPADIPAGFAVCNGAYLDIATYSTLYAIIGTRYGSLVGSTFRLPDLTSRIPRGTVGTPTVPTTVTTSVSSAVDAHTHSVNSSLSLGNLNTHTHSGGVLTAGSTNTSLSLGNLNTHTHSGGTVSGANSTIGNTQAHSHVVTGNTGNASANHGHNANSGNANVNHTHGYFKPNSGGNTTTGLGGALHAHAISIGGSGAAHSHGMLFNSQGANATGINGSNSNIGVNAQGAPNANSTIALTAGNTNTSITAPGAPNANSTIALTAGNATTITGSSSTHTHTTDITELVFIIKVI